MANTGYAVADNDPSNKTDEQVLYLERKTASQTEIRKDIVTEPVSLPATPACPVVDHPSEFGGISESGPVISSNTGQNLCRVQKNMIFRAYDIERMTERVFSTRLHGMKYEANKCRQLCHTLATEIMERVKSLSIKRFKLVAVVSMGSLAERPGMQLGTRCLWDKETDNFVSVRYNNSSLFAVALIYGLHFK